MRRLLARVGESIWAILISLDILLCTLWLAPLYIMGLSGRPTGRQLVSSYVGEAMTNGHRWAIRVGFLIDTVAEWLGDDPHHCVSAYLRYRDLDD